MAWPSLLHRWLLDDRARTGELTAELALCRRVIERARHCGWPKLTLSTDSGRRTIRPTAVAWQYFVCSHPPAVLVRALYSLWPEPASEEHQR